MTTVPATKLPILDLVAVLRRVYKSQPSSFRNIETKNPAEAGFLFA